MIKTNYHPSQTVKFYIDQAPDHDDFPMSLVLLVEAVGQYERRATRVGSI
ncbi:hypothetical protein ACFLT8_03110 [Chloroflexota bacterium]